MTNKIRTAYQCTLQLLTPVHVGTGEMMQKGLDFVQIGNRIYAISTNKMFAAVGELGSEKVNSFTEAIEDNRVEEWLKENGIPPESISRYSFPSQRRYPPRMIYPQIRDGMAKPIIPGSSLKGALRTATVRKLLAKDDNAKDLKTEKNDDRLIRKLLGDNPNTNLLRLLSVGDFSFPGRDVGLQAIEVYLMAAPSAHRLTPKRCNGKPMQPIWVENIQKKAASRGLVSFDDYLAGAKNCNVNYLDSDEKVDLPWLIDACRELTLHTIKTELAFLKDKIGSPVEELRSFYTNDLQRELDNLSDGETIIRMAWGSGWRGMTGQLLEDEDLTESLRRKLKLAPQCVKFPFPKSRRLATCNDKFLPLGWIKLSFVLQEEIRQASQEKQQQLFIQTIRRQEKEAQEEIFKAQWESMSDEARDLAIIRREEQALLFAQNLDPLKDVWPKLDAAEPEHQVALAKAFKEVWESDPKMWHKNSCSKKQLAKVQKVKEILGDD